MSPSRFSSDGRAVEGALPAFSASSSTPHSLLDAATGRAYGAIGLEIERRLVFVISGLGDVPAKQILATAPGFSIVTDHASVTRTADGRLHLTFPPIAPGDPKPQQFGYLIGEIVVEPMAVLPGERRQTPEETLERLARVERALDGRDQPGAAPQTALADLLPADDGWTVTELGGKTLVGQTPVRTNRAYVQPTTGFPALGLSLLQDRAVDRLPKGAIGAVEASGREFAMKATAEFVRAVTGRTDVPDVVVPFLAPVPDVDDLWGYLRFAYAHAVARPTGVILNQGPAAFMVKNGLAVASRPALDRVLRALRPRARGFLDRHHDTVSAGLAATLGRLLDLYRRTITPDKPLFPGYFDATIGDVPSAREHTTSLLTGRTSEGKAVTQKQTVDMDDHRYPTLDTDDGRLDIPLVLTELRHFAYDGEQLMTPEQIRQAVAELAELSREAYRRALAQRAPLPDDVLAESLNRILDNEAVRGLAHFVQMVLMAGLPQPSGSPRRLMSVGESQRISRALGEYALGTPLPADHPLHRALRTAVQEAADAVDTLPPGHRPRLQAMVTAAQGALEVLADPERTPPPLLWASELIAADGSRVLLDRVLAVRHRAADGTPLGTSSRPDQDWQDARRQTYGLLPEVVGFTYVRPGPVTLESPVQNLPFHDAYLVGLRGGPETAALALSDGSDAVVDYARIVDFLFAFDGDLTALAPHRPVVVTGADLAGPPSADPLETPLAGQRLANGLDHWIWTTGSGIEPVLAPGDGPTGPRWQLAEGDWWAGFRPEPSTPELARWAERITGDRGRAPDVLRWVRAVRLVYGPTVDDQGNALATLLHGFWALERTRAANGFTGPLSWSDLRTAVSGYFTENGQAEPPLPVALQFLLLSAAGSVGVDLELSGMAVTPQHHSVRAWDTATPGGFVEDATDQDEEMSLFAPAPAGQPAAPAVPAPATASDAFAGPGDPVLDSQTRITGPSGTTQGRNWTRAKVDRVLPGTLRTLESRPDTAAKVVSTGPAPWPDTAYVVIADGDDGRVLLPDGRELGPEAVADALAADPELAKLPKDVPVVLAVPYTGDRYQQTLQAVADRLGRTVWGPSGMGRAVPDGSGAHVLALLDRDADAPVGDWVSVEPSTAIGSYLDRTWTALDGTVFHDSDVLTVPLTDEDHRHFGRLAVEQKDGLRRRAQRLRRFLKLRELSHRLPEGTDAGTEHGPVGSEPVTTDAAVHVYAGHGAPGRMALPLRDGRTVWLEKADAAAYIAGLPEVRNLPRGHRMHLEVCWSSSDGDPRRQYPSLGDTPHVDDPLDDVPLDQLVANITRRETDGSLRQTGFNDTQRIALASATGQRGGRVLRRPEPLGPALDALARDFGLHRGPDPVSPETRQTMLRLLRAVRSVFGTTFEDHRGRPDGRFERVMKGVVALERMRANDGSISRLTPFRLDMLDFFVQEHTGRAPDKRGYVELLDFAAERIADDANAKLTDAVPAPSLEIALKQLADNGEQMIRHVQSLPAPAPFTARQVASTLWATTRAARLLRPLTPAAREAMGRRILHLDAATAWDRSRQESLWALLTKAVAEGVDAGDQDVMAAYGLAESGAFSLPAVLRQGANDQGINWSGTPMPAGVDWGSVRQMTFGPNGSSMASVQPAWTGPHKPMPVLNVVEVDGAGRIVLHLPGRAPLPVSETEFLALLERDPGLRTLPLKHPVLFLTTGPGTLSPQLVQRFSERTGRPAYRYSAPMMLSSGDPATPLGILALTDPATKTPGTWTRAARQTNAPAAAAGTGDLIVFSPSDRKAGALPDIGSLNVGDTGQPPAGSLLSPATLMTNASGAPRGRNLTDEKVRQLRIGRVRVYEEEAGAPPKEKTGEDRAAPWGDSAYVVWGGSDPDGVRFPDGRTLDAEQLAAELAADPELAKLPQDVPVVLVVPHLANERYLAYLRAVANLLERPVWAPSGDGRLVRNKKREHVPALIDHGPDQPLGSWVPFRPTKKAAPLPDRLWTAVDGTAFRDSDVLTRPLVSDRDERFGRMSHGDDVRGRETLMRTYQRAKKLVHLMASGSTTALISEESRTPDPASYVYVAHGLPGGLQLALRDGRTVWLSAADGGRYIGGLPEVAELPEGHRMKLEVCWSDAPGNPALPQLDNRPAPAVQDPLEEVSLAQHTANVSRRATEGSLMSSGFHTDAHILHDAPGGVAGRRRWVSPEPLPHELDAMARTAGLHTGDGEAAPEVRATTLRLVRALRIVFGPEAEQDQAQHARLLRGIGAMETLRANDQALSRFTPFRMELWTFIAQRVGGKTPGPDDYRKVLDLAAGLLAQKPEAPLGEAIGDPAIQHAIRQATQFGAPLVRNVLRQPENVPVTKRAVTQAFWAMAGAAQQMAGRDDAFTEKLGRRVLHVFPDEAWAPARKQHLYMLTAQAIAAGLDPADFFTLSAFHLASKGAFGPAHQLRSGEGFQGFNWSGGPAPGGIDLRAVGRQDTEDDGASLQHFRAPWAADGEPADAMVAWTDTDAEGFVVLHLPGMRPLRVADREFLALLDLAPPLRTVALGVPVLFVLSGAGSGTGRAAALSEAFSNRTARNGWAYSGALTVAPTTPPAATATPQPGATAAPLRLIGRPETASGRPGAWRKAWLQGLNSSVLVTAPYGDALFSSPKPAARLTPVPDTEPATTALTTPRSLTGAEITVGPPLDRAGLTALVRRVTGPEPVRGLTVERCLVLLGTLRAELFPQGVRPARTVDDTVVGVPATESSLVMGPGWGRVRSWDAVAGAVTAQGPGTVALVLAHRQGAAPGHAWAAYHLSGGGVVWVDLSAGHGRQVSLLPPAVAASDARAVVVGPGGQALEHALPQFAPSSSTAHAGLDAPVEPGYGAIGLEVEERRDLFLDLPGRLTSTLVLAHGPGITLVTDSRGFWMTADGLLHVNEPQVPPGQPRPVRRNFAIGEFVLDPMAVLPGERRQTQEEGMAQLQRARAAGRLPDERQVAVPLTEMLGPLGGWTFTETGLTAKVNPAPEGFDWTAYGQLTLGYPTVGLRELQDIAHQRLTVPKFEMAVAGARNFGQSLTATYANQLLGTIAVESHIAPFLAAIPEVDEVWGYGWLGFQNVVAAPIGDVFDNARPPGTDPELIKNLLPAASRNALDRILRALRPRTRAFLNDHHDQLSADAAEQLGRLLGFFRQRLTPHLPADPAFFDTAGTEVPTPREHWTAVLTGRTSQGGPVSQRYAVGMDDGDYPVLDTDDGRLAVPLVLAELRHFGYTGQFMTPDEIQRAVTELSALSRAAYERALRSRAPLPEDVLRESVRRIVDNPVVQGVAGFLMVAARAGIPQVGGATRRPLSEWDSRNISLALGEYALGRPLHDGHPAYQALRAALTEAYVLLPNIPPGGQARARGFFDAARGALAVLTDPAQTPPVMRWYAEVVAMDGARVLLDRVMVIRHRDAQDIPVGTSSLPLAAWQDGLRQHYGLLPQVTGFTYLRPGPVPLESPVQALPFEDAYLVGLRGGPGGALLALADGTDAAFAYARVVDFLYAVDGDLTALAPERPVLVTGADLAGPPPADPLDTPVAGQQLADGLDRWVWTPGSGAEAFLVPADQLAGPRWQLAEGDWWAGFRPEPSTAELGRWAERITGDRGRTPDVRRWVRAVRLVYGPLLENDATAFEALLRGFWALEQTRAANGFTGPLTWSDLRTAVSGYFTANGQAEPPLPVALQFLLLSAAGSVGVDLELSGMAITPQHHSVRAWDTAIAGPDFFAPVDTAPATAPTAAVPPPATGAFTGPNDPLLAPDTLLTGPSGAAQGRNWTGKNVSRVLPGTLRTIERRPGAAPKVVATDPAPWPDTAYVVTADGEDGRVRTPDGRVLDAGAVADALAADPDLAKLPKDVPVVLAVPYTGDRYLETLRAVADRLGRTVWGPSGVGRIVPDGTGDAHVLVTMDPDPDAPVGAWVSVAPSPTSGPHEDRTWTALDGTVFRDSDVVTRPLADENHQRFGRIAVHRGDALRRRERNFRALRRMRRLVHWTPAGTRAQETASEPVSMDAAVYVYAGHGEPGRMQLPLRDGRTVWLGKHEAAAYIAGLREVRELPPGHRMHLEVCWSSSDGDPARQQPSFAPVPHVDDPLGDVPLDQLVANLTRRDTDGSTRMTGMDDTRRFIMGAADGGHGRRVLRRPEPLADELDRLAGVAGLHRTPGDVPPETREATLRLVRALRAVFGDAIEDDRATPGGRYERALRSIGALERLRANDPALNTFTPFRRDLLDFFVREHTGRAPDLAGYRALLDHAAARVAADPDARLTDAVPSPALQITLKQLADAGEQMIRHVQSLPPQAAFTPRHVASTLWATARAAQLFRPMTPAAREAMGRKVLHLDPATTWGRDQQQAVWAVSAKAIAQGMDATDHDLLAAFQLAESGAFGPASLLRQGPNIQGVNWSGATAPAGIDWSTLRRPDGTVSHQLTPEWAGPGKPMPLLNVIEVDPTGTPVLHLPGRAPVLVPENEFLALLDLAPALRTVSLGIPVLFLTTGPGALSPELVQRFSQRTGRPAYGYSAPMTLTAPSPKTPLGIVALPDPATNAPGRWTAAARRFTAATATGQDQPAFFGPPSPADLGTDPFQDPATVLRDGAGKALGRDLTGAWIDRVRTDRVREVVDGQAASEPDEPAPWGSEAYLVGDRSLDAQGLTPEAFAEKLAADPELAALPPHVPVVLAIPYAGAQYLDLVRAVAGRLGRRVWAPSGDGRLRHDSELQARVPTMTVHDPAGWHGDWVPFDPPAAPAPYEDRQWTSVDGRTFRDSDVATLPLVFDRRVRHGRVSIGDDLDLREQRLRGLFHLRQRIHYVATTLGDQVVSTEPYTLDPAVYTYSGHGSPGTLDIVLRDGSTVMLTAADGGRYIGGLREVRELPPGHRIGLQVCYAASPGHPLDQPQEGSPVRPVEDPLDEVSLIQHTANVSRLDVEGATHTAGLDDDSFMLEDTPGGVVGRLVRVRPEPTDPELDRLAVLAGLHGDPDTVPPEVRATVLRLVRALRLVFDHAVEDDRWVPGGGYERALKGIAALETLRANDPGMRRFTPFRMELWTFLARRVGGDTPGRDAYRNVLDAARQLIGGQPDSTLSGMLPDTPLTYAVDELSGSQGEYFVRDAVGLPEPVTLRPKDITRAFWAMVAGADLVLFRLDPAQQESLGRRALHLADSEMWSDATTAELTFLAVRAHARQIDITDPHQLAAHHLRELGALGQTLTDGTEPTGYNWSGRPAPNGVESGQWYARIKAGNDVLTLPHPAQWRSTEPGGKSLVIWSGTRADDGGIVIHLPGHAPLPVPDEELWALLDLAPLVTDAGVDVPVVFPMAGFTNGKARRTQPFTDRTGRSAFGYSGPLDLIEDDPFDPLRITALREKKLGQWSRTTWKPAQGAVTGTPGAAVKTGPSAWPVHSARHDSGTGTFHFTTGAPRRAQETDGESGRPDIAYPSAVRINATPVSTADQDDAQGPDPADAAPAATGPMPAAATGPAWALRSWRPAGSPGTARFAALYRDREWQRRSTAFELAFAAHTGRAAGLTEAARDAVSRMAGELTARHGEQAALRAFFAPDAPPGDPAAALERLLTAPPGPLSLAALMTAFTYAAHAGHGLPRETAETLARPPGRQGRYTPGSSYREVHDSRGMRRVGGEDGPALRLLRTYAALGAAPDGLTALRDALIAWAIPADLQSLHEILRASHRVGGGTAAERDTALRDGAGLHTWAAGALVAGSADADGEGRTDRPAAPVPPHLALYAERMTFGRDITRSGLNLPDDLAQLADAALAGTLQPDTARNRALLAWLDRYGDAGRDALRRLSPAHLTAIHLYSGADYRLMKAFLNGERFGAGMGRRLVRLNAWTMTSKMAEVGAADLLPMTLRRQRGFTALFDAMWDVDDLQERTAEVAALRSRLDAMADAVFAELPSHVDMVVEALEILPPLHGDVWWGDRGMPGPLGAPPSDGPVYGRNRITVPYFRSTALERDEALGFMHRSKGAPGDSHLGLVHVSDSTAREVSPFVVLPLETEVLYPPGASFDVTTRTLVPGDPRTRAYESIDVTEAATTGTASGTPDELFGIAPPADTQETPSRRAPVLRTVRRQDGSTIGIASFDDADWAERQQEYGRLADATGFVSWERDTDGRHVPTHRALPGGGTTGGTFFFASHGGGDGLALATEDGGRRTDDGSYAGRLLRSAGTRGFGSVTVLACGPGDVPRNRAEALARAERIADRAGLPVHLPTGRVAVSDGLPHLLEDADGQPTEWVTAYPAGWTGPRVPTPGTSAAGRTAYRYPAPGQFNVQGRVLDAAPEELDDLDADRGTPWSVSSWSPAGAPGTPRFTGFYRERAWRQASVDWEDSLAEALSEVPRLAEAAGLAVRGLYGQLALRNGEERAARAFFDPDETPDDPAAELERLLDEPPGPEALDGLMRAFVYASYAGPGLPTPVHEALTEGGGRFGGDSAYRAVHDSRGFRRVGGERGPALHLLRVAAALGLPSELLPPFRAAVAAWTIPYDLQSLHEVLRASHLIGMGTSDERGAAARDGAALHTWTVDAFTADGLLPREDVGRAPAALVPPHQALYQDRMSFPFELTGTMDVPDALVTMADAALAGALPSLPTPRLQIMAAWLERYGDRGAAALRQLTPAHITALYLYSSYDYRLMKALLNGERLGRGVSRHLVRFHSWQYLLESAREEELDMPPLTLVSRPEFADLYAELTELPDLDTPHPDLAALRRRADAMADRLHDELRLHIDMAIEALEILPPVDRTIWWGERGAPGPVERPALNGPLYGDGAIEVAFFRSTSLQIEEAVEFALSDKPVPARSHRRLIEVANSTARDAAPFLKHLSEGEALYPPGMRFDVVSRRLVESYRRPPMLHEVAEETTPLPDGLSEEPRTGPVPYTPAVFEDTVDDVFDLGRSDSDLSDVELSDVDGYSETDSDTDSGLVDADPSETATRAYPRHDYWNAPWEGQGTAPATQQIVVQEIEADGRTVGKASFTRRDWALREPFYSRLPQATHYTEWSRGPAQERVAHRRPLPATGASGTFFWTSHGGPEGYSVAGANDLPAGADSAAVGRLLGPDLAAAGFTSITVLACDVATATGGPAGTAPGGESLERAVRRAADIADLTGLDVYLTTGRTAITPGRDEDG
ncbi:lonely Cys domain-containing protein, partial [Streptomyces sp. MBT55]|uniref:lonely Cys domain-containing protein n=1 Tax=Streptomyces sp. MBT55 TaxID=1488386 RepID=UPI0027DE0237